MKLLDMLLGRVRWVLAGRTSTAAVALALTSRVSMLVLNVLTGVIVARSLGPAGRGAAAAIYLWPGVVSGLLTLGVPAALRYQVRRKLARAEDLFTSALSMSVVLGIVSVAVGVLIVPHFLTRYPARVSTVAMWMMCFAPFMLINATIQAFYESLGNFKLSSSMISIPPALAFTGVLALYFSHRITPYTVPLVSECSYAVITFATLLRLRNYIRPTSDMFKHIRSQLNYGLRAYGMDVVNTLAGQVDQAMVVGLLSAASFGLYAVAIAGSRILLLLGSSLNSVLFPTASGLDGPGAIDLVSRSARIVVSLTLVSAVLFVIALPTLVSVAYGKQYFPVIALTQLLTISVVLTSATSTFGQAFMATGRPEIATMLQCGAICFTIPLMLILIPRFGLTGAAYAVDLSSLLRLACTLACYPIFLRHRVPRVVINWTDAHYLFGRLRKSTIG